MKILITGDFCPTGKTETLINDNKFDLLFENFTDVLKSNDFCITNLECPITESSTKIEKTGPHLKSSLNTVEALKFAGFNIATLATNHIMDYGVAGLTQTIEILEKNNIKFVGVGASLIEARKYLIIEKEGKKVAIINIAENEFSNTNDNNYGANPLNLAINFEDIQKAKADSDFVLIIFHGGNEHFPLPSTRLKETFRFFVNAGANAVIAHHTHCFSGYEVYRNAPIFYSLGNFVFDYKNQNNSWHWSTGYAVSLNIENGINFEIIPYSQFYLNSLGISLLENENLHRFKNEIDEYNRIIADDSLLKIEFEKLVNEREQWYLNYLAPFDSKWLISLNTRKLLPNFLTNYKKMLLRNLIRCESHRDILLAVLNNKTDK
jgi:poly-gamma-glutamate capsule biosynthesis protein CapA/YwtB (metallophosphatase superfamily)